MVESSALVILIDNLTILAGVLALGAFIAYTAVSRWWQTKSGTATWMINFMLVLLLAHFVGEAYEGQVLWREALLLVLFCAVLLYWFVVVIYKRWFWKDPHKKVQE